MTPARARAIVEELAKRNRPSVMLESAFPAQRRLLDDGAKFKAVLCTRRAGKSFGGGLALCDSASRYPGTAQLYLGLTRDTVRRIMVDPVLKVMNRRFSLGATFVDRPLEMRFQNGSVIYMLGVDASDDERDKILGQKFKRVVVDECGSMRYDLRSLIQKTIRPTLVDLSGDLMLTGTPENTKNYFYEVTEGQDSSIDWSLHRWSAFDNPHIAEQWKAEIAELTLRNPAIVDTPLYRQHYLGEWSVDTSALVYKYDSARNYVDVLPFDIRDAHVVLSLDLGYNDPTAISILAWTDTDPTLYVVESFARKGLTVGDVAVWVQTFMRKYSPERLVVDPASKQVVEELRQRYRIPLESAEKSGKVQAIAMLNSDMLTGRLKVVGEACAELVDEWAGLVWDERRLPAYEENPTCKNDRSDSVLYGWRTAYNFVSAPRSPPPDRDDEDAIIDAEELAMNRDAKTPFWERD